MHGKDYRWILEFYWKPKYWEIRKDTHIPPHHSAAKIYCFGPFMLSIFDRD